MNDAVRLRRAARLLHAGRVIAHPTEGVYGLACNPADDAAILRLLAIKQRPASKGLILIAADFNQLVPWLAALPQAMRTAALATWPGPVTWLLPAAAGISPLLSGGSDRLAVRVTAHPLAAALCRQFGGALVSTSANRSGAPAALSASAVRQQLGRAVDAVLTGALSTPGQPSRIIDGRSGHVLRG